MSKLKISFDFDGTLSLDRIQTLALNLANADTSLYILTTRLDNMRRMKFGDIKDNSIVYEVASRVGIPAHHISFTNQQSKWVMLHESGIHIHIDDDKRELENLAWYGIVKGFHVDDVDLEEKIKTYSSLILNEV